MRWFSSHIQRNDHLEINSLGNSLLGLSIAGPSSRDLMQKVSESDCSSKSFRFMELKLASEGLVECLVARVSYKGDLGFELWMESEFQRYVYVILESEGKEYGIQMFGLKALNALRVGKNYGSWARKYRPIYGPLEADLEKFLS